MCGFLCEFLLAYPSGVLLNKVWKRVAIMLLKFWLIILVHSTLWVTVLLLRIHSCTCTASTFPVLLKHEWDTRRIVSLAMEEKSLLWLSYVNVMPLFWSLKKPEHNVNILYHIKFFFQNFQGPLVFKNVLVLFLLFLWRVLGRYVDILHLGTSVGMPFVFCFSLSLSPSLFASLLSWTLWSWGCCKF